jgi:hypothetical protein
MEPQQLSGGTLDVWRGVSKGEEVGRRLPNLRTATLGTPLRTLMEWPPAGHREIGNGEPAKP